VRTIYIYALIITATVFASSHSLARDSCWNWYGTIKCSLKTEGSSVRNKLVYPEGTVEKRCKTHPYLAEHIWKECEPYLKEILNQQ